ncbi:MAG: peptidylprolyl isomerase [Bacteroidales bacterium]|nr:peptidylprolyl isomerase [Bacteroidales bacterium]MBQ8644910.1 peptidylprolyl isomerase [Bacteroidales bacterium]MBR1949280.1 peptidylprolyl isomerase [Bacteroidales bacterium]MBR4088486.1 peptidylprolyl isomerase [Bacteroidales bacterium]
MKTRLFSLLVIATILVAGCKSGNKEVPQPKPEAAPVKVEAPALAFNPDSLPQEPVFNIVTSKGTIKIKLYKETPLHRDNFVKLASKKFYDNILFHRVIKNFMIQVGDPLTKDPSADPAKYGTGGPGYTIPAEIMPQFKHKKGALAAARKGDKSNPARESSGSQFYFVESETGCSHLDGQYTIFGETIEGFDVIDAIAAEPVTAPKNAPVNPIRIISVMPAE